MVREQLVFTDTLQDTAGTISETLGHIQQLIESEYFDNPYSYRKSSHSNVMVNSLILTVCKFFRLSCNGELWNMFCLNQKTIFLSVYESFFWSSLRVQASYRN